MNTILTYLTGIGFQEVMLTIIFSVGFLLLVFLALRAILLWYWKVTVVVKNQQQQIILLQDILLTLKNSIKKTTDNQTHTL